MKFAENRIFSSIAILFPILAWVTLILIYSVNVPWFDDFDPFLDFIDKWTASTDVLEKIGLIFQPNNEHRMVFGKLLNLIYFQLAGQVNFTAIHCMAAAFTLGTCLILWQVFKGLKLHPLYFVPVTLLLFQVQYHLIFLWAICGMQHETVVFFVCLTCFLLAKNRFGWALIAALCSNFAMSNGIFVWVSGLAILLLSSNWKRVAIWLPTAIVAVLLYFHGMSPQGNEEAFSFFAKNPELSLIGFLGTLGGIFDINPDKPIEFRLVLPIIMGFVAVAWIAFWLTGLVVQFVKEAFLPKLKSNAAFSRITNAVHKNPTVVYFAVGVLTFLLANAAVIGFLRPRFGLFVVVVSNYKLYPALFFATVYLTLLTSFKESVKLKTLATLSVIIAVGVYCFSLLHYLPILAERRKYLLVHAYNQEHHAFGLGFEPTSPAANYIDKLMARLISKGYYQYPSEEISFYINKIKTISGPLPSDLNFQIQEQEDGIKLTEQNHPYLPGKKDGLFVFFRKGEAIRIYKMDQFFYGGRNPLIHYDKGAETTVLKASLAEGIYEVGALRIHNNTFDGGIIERITIEK